MKVKENLLRFLIVIAILLYVVYDKFSCFFVKNHGWKPCYYEGFFGMPQPLLLYWFIVAFFLIVALKLVLSNELFSLFNLILILLSLFYLLYNSMCSFYEIKYNIYPFFASFLMFLSIGLYLYTYIRKTYCVK